MGPIQCKTNSYRNWRSPIYWNLSEKHRPWHEISVDLHTIMYKNKCEVQKTGVLISSKAFLSTGPNYGGYISPSETYAIISIIEVSVFMRVWNFREHANPLPAMQMFCTLKGANASSAFFWCILISESHWCCRCSVSKYAWEHLYRNVQKSSGIPYLSFQIRYGMSRDSITVAAFRPEGGRRGAKSKALVVLNPSCKD